MYCGNSSVGRAQPCQGWGREFESRFPLKIRWLAKCQPFFIFCKQARTSDPKLPPSRGLEGVNKCSREKPARSAGSTLVFRSKSDGWLNANHFYFLQTDSHERPQVAPCQGVGGVRKCSREMHARSAGSSLVFRSKSKAYRNLSLLFCLRIGVTREEKAI